MKRTGRRRRSQRGQTVVEYVLLISMIAGLVRMMWAMMPAQLQRVEGFLQQKFRNSYQLGDSEASMDEGTPKRHPRALNRGNENFRIFRRVHH